MILLSIFSFFSSLFSHTFVDQSQFVLFTLCNISSDLKEEDVDKAFDKLKEIEHLLDYFKEDSIINTDLENKELVHLTSYALKMNKKTNSYFNPVIRSLSLLWKKVREERILASDWEIEKALNDSNINNISIKNDKIVLKEGTHLDLSALSKGYAADQLDSIFKGSNTLVNLGGNVKIYGKNKEGKEWKIAIQDPNEARGTYLGIYRGEDLDSIVTSALYEQAVEIENKIYSHIIDPFTGRNINNKLSSVTIIDKSSIDADIFATSLLVMDEERAIKFAKDNNLKAIIVNKDKKIYLSEELKDRFSLKNSTYTLIYI